MKDIQERTLLISKNINKALEWAKNHNDNTISSSISNALRPLSRKLITIERASKKRPSIAIFGQSQVGKSYLVQNLAKPQNETFLKIKAGENLSDLNFLAEMNPDGGGKESTGLVTRFTTQGSNSNPEFPFHAELFNQLDIAAILINSYWSDLKEHSNYMDEINLDKVKENILNIKKDSYQKDIEEVDIYYFINYVLTNFEDVYLIKELKKKGYFEDLYNALRCLTHTERWHVLEILWGNNKFITEVFKTLCEALASLQYAQNIALPLRALSPKKSSIIDVERVRELFNAEKASNELTVLIKGNTKVTLSRAVLSVLTKEVQLEIANSFTQDQDRKFMEHSDLLDFPGSKSRERIPLTVFNENTSEDKLQLLIRGKVSYLFDTYTNHLGVGTLLYCMDDGPQEEKEAPNRLYKWVKKYVGDNVEDRSQKLKDTLTTLNSKGNNLTQVSPLLVILTKFNEEINNVMPGSESNLEKHDSKWAARIGENFVSSFSRPVEDKWLSNWTNEHKKFNFVFPIRDPMYSQATFEGYETDDRETRIRPEREEAMKAIGLSFNSSEYIQNHIINPKEIWTELSSPNGSGVKYLSKYLKGSSDPELTRTRFNFELNKINRNLKSIIKPHLISGNLDEDLQRSRKEAVKSYTGIIGLANRQDNVLSHLMKCLIISDTEVWNILYDHIFKNLEVKTEEEINVVDVDVLESFNDLGIQISEDTTHQDIVNSLEKIYEGNSYDEIREIILDFINFDINNIDQVLRKEEPKKNDSLTDLIIKEWLNKCIESTMNNKLVDKLSEKQQEAFKTIVYEILRSRERLELKKEIQNIINDIQVGTINVNDIDLVASSCSKILNNFLFSAGWSIAAESEKPIAQNAKNPIFSVKAKEFDIRQLHYVQNEVNKTFFKEWSYGCKTIFESNVKYEYGVNANTNTNDNIVLNEIIESIEKNN